jgi:biotin carboxyl carrier protein
VAQKYLVRLDDEELSFELRAGTTGIEVRREDQPGWHACELARVGDSDLYLLLFDNRPTELYIERRRGGADVTIGRHTFTCDVGPWRPPGLRRSVARGVSGPVRITAPMTGSIVEVRCAEGDAVEAGDVLLVIESMKMNNELRSPAAGIVESVPVTAGQRVKANDLLVAIRSPERLGESSP